MHEKNKPTNLNMMAKLWWLLPLLLRSVTGIYFIRTGLNKLYGLNHTKEVLNFFWIAVPAEHRWDPLIPFVGLICGTFVLLGLWTRAVIIPLFGILVAAVLNAKFKGISGLNLSAFQEFAMIALLIGLWAEGAGSFSLDQVWGKRPIDTALNKL